MAVNISDAEIAALIAEAKPLPNDYQKKIQTNRKRVHRERELDIQGENGSSFRLILRQSVFNPLDFSVILAWLPPQSATPFRLCRYNGNRRRSMIFMCTVLPRDIRIPGIAKILLRTLPIVTRLLGARCYA